MNVKVLISKEAREDFIDLYLFVAEHDSVSRADVLLENLKLRCMSLHTAPERGHDVPELKRIHIEGFREIHFKPYRIVYQIINGTVHVHAVLDGRRDLQEFLEQRVLR
jgi:toxin ParE1/3/4